MTEDYLIKLSCYDFRTEKEMFNRSKDWVYVVLLPKLKKLQAPLAHLSYLRPIKIGHIYAELRNPEKWKELRDKYVGKTSVMIREMKDIPLPRYIHKFYLLSDRTIAALYYAPEEMKDEIIARLDSYYDEVQEAKVYPVINCTGKLLPQVELEDVEKYGRMMLERLNNIKPYYSRNRLLDYMLVAVLERYPLLTLRDLPELTHFIRARIEEEVKEEVKLRRRYVLKHYRELSARYVLGRILIPQPSILYPAFIVEKKSMDFLYGLSALTMGAVHFVELEDRVFASIALIQDPKMYLSLNMLTPSIIGVVMNVLWIVSPFPFEMYNPITDEWSLEKPAISDLVTLVRKFRLEREKVKARA
jgi:hypothetical protein